jgi:DNA-binding winged helix-turn-helix (wHTH) protein/tetratricopeptide (TPR) repeat protein
MRETATEKPATPEISYSFGLYVLDPATGALTRNGIRVRLQEQPFRLLLFLVERPGQIVSREEIRNHLWPQNTFVEFDKSLGVAALKVREALGDDANNPRFVETVPRRGYRFIAPVAIQQPQSTTKRADAPGAVNFAGEPTAETKASPSRNRNMWYVGAVVAFVSIIAFVTYRSARSRSQHRSIIQPTSATVHLRRSVAVLGFRNLARLPEEAWLSDAFSEMLNTELAAGGRLRMVSGEDVARAKSELPLSAEDSLAKSTLQELRINPGADVVVVGSYTTLPTDPQRKIRLDVRLQDTAGGETIAEEAVSGDENDIFTMVADLGDKLRQELGAGPVSEESALATRAALPSNEKAARLYAEGRAKLWGFDFFAARDLLREAIAADPNFPLAHAALSDVWWHTGYDAKARVEAKRAMDLSNHLSQEQRLLVEGQYQRTILDWPKTVETYRSLFQLFPDNLDYGILIASAQMHLTPADSLQTLADLRRLPLPLGDDARIDMTEASAWINRDFTKARIAAMQAIAKAHAEGSPVIVSRTYGILCQQEPSIGASDEAINDCKNALESSLAAKDPNGEAMMRTDLAVLYYLRGNIENSAQMFQQAIKKFRQVGNRDGIATALSNFADARLSQGNLKEARKLLEEAITEYQAIDDQEGIALNFDSLGDVWRQTGELDRSESAYKRAESVARKIDDKDATAYVLNGMGDLALDRGDLASARKFYEEALGLRIQAGEKQTAAESRVSLAKLAIEEGHASDAETSSRASQQQFHEEHQDDDELSAGTVLINALLAQGKQGEAEAELKAIQQLGSGSQNRLLHLEFELASGRVLLGSDHPENSGSLFHQIKIDTQRYGFVGLGFGDDLALAELARKTKRATEGQNQLRALQKAASSKGFGLLARKAAAAQAHTDGIIFDPSSGLVLAVQMTAERC